MKKSLSPPPQTPPAPTASPSCLNHDTLSQQNATSCYTPPDVTDPFNRANDPALPAAARAIIRLRQHFPSLNERQLNAVELVVLGHTDKRVATRIGADRTTVTRWRLYNPHFKAAVSRRRQEVWGSSADRFRHSLHAAIRIIRRQLRSTNEHTAFRAARMLLYLAACNRFAPPNDPIDVHGVIERLARKKHLETNAQLSDHENDPLEDCDYLAALNELDEQQRNFPLAPDPHHPNLHPAHDPSNP